MRWTNWLCFCFAEWIALYTTQLTQKAKKYHDGFVRLVQAGPHVKQVIRSIRRWMVHSLHLPKTRDGAVIMFLIECNYWLFKSSYNQFMKCCDMCINWMFRLFCLMRMAKC
jgi:hypothetical protein